MQAKLGVPYWRLVQDGNNGVTGAALVVKRQLPWGKSWLYVPRGPVVAAGLHSFLWQQIIELAKKENTVFIRVEPALPPGSDWRKAVNDVQPRHTSILGLTKTEDESLAAMHQKTRYNIRLAQKRGVTIRFSTNEADIEHFLRLSSDVHERSAFHYHPDSYYRAMRDVLSPAGNFKVAVAEHEGDVLAVHLLIAFGDTVTYTHGASSSAKRDLMAPHLLQWESIKWAKAAGYTNYDFFGIAPAFAEATAGKAGSPHPWAGITRFKEGFGGERVSYVGAYDYILDPIWYWTYSTSRRARSLWR